MTLAVPSAPLTVTLSASSISMTLFTDGVDYTIDAQKFSRKEWSNTFLLNLQSADGSTPNLVKNAINKNVQINYTCSSYNTARSTVPDDLNINNILQKIVVKSYTITGAPSSPSAVDALYSVALDHERRYQVFESYLDRLGLNLSYDYFIGLRNETFSYLQNTGLSLVGNELMSENNCLIRKYNQGILYSDPKTSTVTCKGWSLQIWVVKFIESTLVL